MGQPLNRDYQSALIASVFTRTAPANVKWSEYANSQATWKFYIGRGYPMGKAEAWFGETGLCAFDLKRAHIWGDDFWFNSLRFLTRQPVGIDPARLQTPTTRLGYLYLLAQGHDAEELSRQTGFCPSAHERLEWMKDVRDRMKRWGWDWKPSP